MIKLMGFSLFYQTVSTIIRTGLVCAQELNCLYRFTEHIGSQLDMVLHG